MLYQACRVPPTSSTTRSEALDKCLHAAWRRPLLSLRLCQAMPTRLEWYKDKCFCLFTILALSAWLDFSFLFSFFFELFFLNFFFLSVGRGDIRLFLIFISASLPVSFSWKSHYDEACSDFVGRFYIFLFFCFSHLRSALLPIQQCQARSGRCSHSFCFSFLFFFSLPFLDGSLMAGVVSFRGSFHWTDTQVKSMC